MTLHLAETAKERPPKETLHPWKGRLVIEAWRPLPAFLPAVFLAVLLAVMFRTEMSAHYLQVLPALVLSAALCH